MPSEGLKEWMKRPEAERKAEEQKMQTDWNAWMLAHGSALKETNGAGKTQRVTSSGIAQTPNDVMLYSMLEAESDEAAAALFADHPHLAIPGSWIDVMPANNLPSM